MPEFLFRATTLSARIHSGLLLVKPAACALSFRPMSTPAAPDELQQKLLELRATLAQKRAARKASGEESYLSDYGAQTAATPLEKERASAVLGQLQGIQHEPAVEAATPTPIEPPAEAPVAKPAPEPIPIDPNAPSAPDADELAAFRAALQTL